MAYSVSHSDGVCFVPSFSGLQVDVYDVKEESIYFYIQMCAQIFPQSKTIHVFTLAHVTDTGMDLLFSFFLFGLCVTRLCLCFPLPSIVNWPL